MQNKRTLILFIILLVVLTYYILTTFILSAGTSDIEATQNQSSFEKLGRTGQLVEKIHIESMEHMNLTWKNDPFNYPEKESAGMRNIFGDIGFGGPSLKLHGIVWDKNDVPTILINNQVLKLGDFVDGFKIINVGVDFVILRNNKERIQLTLGE